MRFHRDSKSTQVIACIALKDKCFMELTFFLLNNSVLIIFEIQTITHVYQTFFLKTDGIF